MPDSRMTADEALTCPDPFSPFGFDPNRYAEIIFYRCRQCGARGPVGRALLDVVLHDLPETEQAAHTWPTDHGSTDGHPYSDRISLCRPPASTTIIRRLSKATRPAGHA